MSTDSVVDVVVVVIVGVVVDVVVGVVAADVDAHIRMKAVLKKNLERRKKLFEKEGRFQVIQLLLRDFGFELIYLSQPRVFR